VTRDALLRALQALPAAASLTLAVGELREALGDQVGPADLDVATVARRFDRSPSTVRSWCETGLLPGAYRLRGRSWRIPPAALDALRAPDTDALTAAPPSRPRRKRRNANLGAWRDEVPA